MYPPLRPFVRLSRPVAAPQVDLQGDMTDHRPSAYSAIDMPRPTRCSSNDGPGVSLRQPFVPPRDPQEELVANVFADVLHIDRVGAFDNFFELGGDSLSAMRALARVGGLFGVSLAADNLFKWPTVAELSAGLKSAANAGQSAASSPIVPRGRKRRVEDV